MGLVVFISGIASIANPQKGVSAARPAGIVGVVAGTLWIVWAVWVVARMGVTTNEKGVVLRSWVRRRFVGWDEVTGFSFGADIQNPSLRVLISTPMLST